jgi:E-phenylitaconyl-CoA hydratase
MTSPTGTPGLVVTRDEHVMTLTLNRPDAGNSLDPETVAALAEAWRTAATDEDVWVVVLTGTGQRFFCTGSDLKKTPPPQRSFIADVLNGSQVAITPPPDFLKPTIAAINGMAVGGGLELALACDLRIASTTAQFGLSEVKVGSLAGQGGTQRLMRALPQAVAMKMLLTGERIDADDAHRLGLVSDLHSPEELGKAAAELARTICAAAPLSVRAAKMAATQGAGLPLRDGLALENQLWGALRDTEDRLEGRQAFAEKRPPRWRAR